MAGLASTALADAPAVLTSGTTNGR